MSGEERAMVVRLPAELHNAVKARAVEDDRTMAALIRTALRFYLQETAPVASR